MDLLQNSKLKCFRLADQVDCVQEYLKFVVEKGIELYGPTYPTINVHTLLHLVDDYEVIWSNN